jgi:hypothetical protein
MALPKLSAEQRQQALAKATAARHARSELLRQVTTGQLTVQDVLDRAATDETVKKTKVLQMVKALPGYGTTKAARLLDHADIPDNRRIGGLGTRQQQTLLDALT